MRPRMAHRRFFADTVFPKGSVMQLSKRKFLVMVTGLVLLAAILPFAVRPSQADSITLSLVIPDYLEEAFTNSVVSDFESANPGVTIHLVKRSTGSIPPAAEGLDAHLDAMGKYVSSGDVLMVNARTISPASVSAGYFLDLAPLASADGNLNPDDFQQPVWQAFQWDNGMWALPAAATVWFMQYDANTLAQAGFSEPPSTWTLDEFANAIQQLTVKDANGQVQTPALMGLIEGYNDGMIIASLGGFTFTDPTTQPETPSLDKEGIDSFATTWSALMGTNTGITSKGRFGQIPLNIVPHNILISTSSGPAAQAAPETSVVQTSSLLPGNRAGLDVEAFAVSGGTQYPEQAYALAKYLTTRPEIASLLSSLPARTSLFEDALAAYSPDDQTFLRTAIEAAIPTAKLRFMDYFSSALKQMKDAQVDAKTALEAETAQAVSDQQAAIARKATDTIFVATPAPPPNLQAGEVAIKFGVGEFADPLPTQALWDDVIADFISHDPQVRQIVFEKDFRLDTTNKDNYDCFYMPINMMSAQAAGSLLSLDPLLAADPTFDKDDMIGSTLERLTIDGKVWAMPIVIFPSVLKYNRDVFNQAGVSIPDSSWTVDQFKDTLIALKQNTAGDPPFFLNGYSNGSPLLMLMAAYGGIPLDFRTSPPTINFTEAATVTAIREVLDLAKQGYIKYPTLSDLTGSSNPGVPTETTALYDDSLNVDNETAQSPFKPISYPRGTQFAGTSYGIGFAAIMATSANPDACYRWISTFAKHPELFSGMPTRRSLINDPALSAAQGSEMVTTYNAIADQLADPNTLIMPDPMNADPTIYLLQHWLNEAFDKGSIGESRS